MLREYTSTFFKNDQGAFAINFALFGLMAAFVIGIALDWSVLVKKSKIYKSWLILLYCRLLPQKSRT